MQHQKNKLRISFIVPIFNNATTIIGQLKACDRMLKKYCDEFEALLCDDGSIDGSAAILRRWQTKHANYHVIYHKQNLGIARTIRELYEKSALDYIFLYSIDGDWNPSDAEKMLQMLIQSNAEIVVGKRIKTNYTLYRKIITRIFNVLPVVLFGVPTIDAGSIKIVKRKLFNSLTLVSQGLFYEAEIIIRAQIRRHRVVTCPVTYHKITYTSGSAGKFSNIFASLGDIFILFSHAVTKRHFP